MESLFFYLFVALGIFAIGDAISAITKGRISTVFATLIIFLIAFMAKWIPANIIDAAGLGQVAKWSSAFLVFHMGTFINIKELIKEWRTVALSIVAMAVTIVAILACIPLVGREAAIVAIPVMKGGIIATQIVTSVALEKGLQVAAAFAALVYAIHKFVGTPFASYYGVKEAEFILQEYRAEKQARLDNPVTIQETKLETKKPLYVRLGLEKYYTDATCMATTAFFAWISILVDKWTGVNYSISVLILGTMVNYFELVPAKILEKAKSNGFFNIVVFAAIIPSMAKVTFSDLITMSYQMAILFTATLLSTFLCFYVLPLWKIVRSRELAIGITMANMVGFPATWLIVTEVAGRVAKNEEERDVLMKKLMPAYVVAGFATVTTLSIIIAGIFAKYI